MFKYLVIGLLLISASMLNASEVLSTGKINYKSLGLQAGFVSFNFRSNWDACVIFISKLRSDEKKSLVKILSEIAGQLEQKKVFLLWEHVKTYGFDSNLSRFLRRLDQVFMESNKIFDKFDEESINFFREFLISGTPSYRTQIEITNEMITKIQESIKESEEKKEPIITTTPSTESNLSDGMTSTTNSFCTVQ